jgi:hypothetical protein
MSKRVYESVVSALKKLEIPRDPNIISTWQKSFVFDSELDLISREIQLLSAWRHKVFLVKSSTDKSLENPEILSAISNGSSIPLIDFRDSREFFEAVVIYPYKKSVHDELELELGGVIVVTKVEGRGSEWWYGSTQNSMGWFPAAYVVKR